MEASTLGQPGSQLHTPVQFLKGIGPKLASTLQKLGLNTVEDVLYHLPRRYEDRTNLPLMRSVRPGQFVTVRGQIIDIETRSLRGGKVLLRAVISDKTGQITLSWFNQPWIAKKLSEFKGEIIAYGQAKAANWGLEINGPEWELVGEDEESENFGRIVPVYPLSEGVQQWVVRRAVESALPCVDQIKEIFPLEFRKAAKNLAPIRFALQQIHRPESEQHRKKARERLVFDDFFFMQLSLQLKRAETQQEVGISFPISKLVGDGRHKSDGSSLFGSLPDPMPKGETLEDEIKRLFPFHLTAAQDRVIKEIYRDMERPHPMNRLVQGDVGSGKTAVAACAMLAAVRCGYQACLMAPTEVLAEQHYINLHRIFDQIGVKVALLVGKQGSRERKASLKLIESGEARIIVGTHALIQDQVSFQHLGFIVIDEQHRFGVLQRAALRQKSHTNPDVLVMTATPIPRTLTMTIYGDLELSVIDELPPGRMPIKTTWKQPQERPAVYSSVRKLVDTGIQAYFVCPMIAESEKMQTQAAVDLHYRLQNDEFSDLKIGLLHGQMKAAEKEAVMDDFRAGKLQILVSTVVIEVGVDVPNAAIMVIEDAHRFGLSQLHQLRGRVGRGMAQSYCVLIADVRTEEALQRIEVMVSTSDGFKIAEEDLRIRGPGDVAGTKQSGNLDFRVADLIQDSVMLEVARDSAMRLLSQDPQLSMTEHAGIAERVSQMNPLKTLITVS